MRLQTSFHVEQISKQGMDTEERTHAHTRTRTRQPIEFYSW